MKNQIAVVLGSTGLTGKMVVQQLISNEAFSTIRLPVRKTSEQKSPKTDVLITDFNDMDNLANNIGEGNQLFCCLGTTLSAMKGNKDAYRKVDHDIAVNAAKIGIREGFTQFLLISSVGADAGSSNFYLTLKGEIEKNISLIPFQGIHIFRPSILLGSRKELRVMERLGQIFMRIFSFLFIGTLRKYRPIDASDLAKAMVEIATSQIKGIHIYHYDQIRKFASRTHSRDQV